MFCTKCGKEIENGSSFCVHCGEPIDIGTSVPAQQSVQVYASPQVNAPVKIEQQFKPATLICIIICLVLCFAAPFIAINISTLRHQPSAFQLIIKDVTVIGNLEETLPYWSAMIVLIGMIICFFCTIFKKNTATRVLAVISLLSLLASLLEIFTRVHDGNIKDVLKYTGIGYWGILILVIAIIASSGNRKKVPANYTSNTASTAALGFCTNCGKPLYKGDEFCTSCGQPADAVAPTNIHVPLTNETKKLDG